MLVIGIYWIAVLTLYKSITSTYAEHTDWINFNLLNFLLLKVLFFLGVPFLRGENIKKKRVCI